ncbi:Insulinase (Peptidase M16), partial [Ascosphaera aggregata]
MSSIKRICSSLVTPLLDNRCYRVIRLSNGLEALLIHDPETDKASASMDVSVGNYNDPEDIQGLAHCLEHALFMGTEKYPKENEYRHYLAANAGHSNAWTNQCNTNYHFEVAATSSEGDEQDDVSEQREKEDGKSPQEGFGDQSGDDADESLSIISSSESLSDSSSITEAEDCDCHPSSNFKDSDPYSASPLYGALSRFAQFFICPLFLSSSLSRELHAVDSENKKNYQNDTWRLRQLSKSLSNPLHPYHKFICGNLETLEEGPARIGKDIRNELIKFYKKEYSANKMKLVVLGREELDVLEGWVGKLFSAVPTHPSSPLTQCPTEACDAIQCEKILSYPASHLSKLISVTPIMDRRELHIRFAYQDEDHLPLSQPGRYLTHLIGHEGPGSILYYLKARNWANNLYAGPHYEGPDNAFFMIYIHLTNAGLSQYEKVVKVIFRYLSLLRHEGVQAWIWEEMKLLADVEFKWKAKAQNAMMFVTGLANKMHKPLEKSQLLTGYEVLGEYDEMALKEATELLRPERCNLTILSKHVVRDKKATGLKLQKERWYGTEYILEDLSPQLISEMKRVYYQDYAEQSDGELHLPNPNPFIPTDLAIHRPSIEEVPARHPSLLIDDEHIRLWHKKDDTFFVPKATIHLLLCSPLLDPSTVTLPNSVAVEIYCKLITDTLTEFSYDACLTGYTYSLAPASRNGGIQISVTGYSDKIYTLLRKIL